MTRDEALTALANVGITKYRVTGNAAFFETSDGRRAKITAWTDDITSQQVTDLKAELSQMPIDGDSASLNEAVRFSRQFQNPWYFWTVRGAPLAIVRSLRKI